MKRINNIFEILKGDINLVLLSFIAISLPYKIIYGSIALIIAFSYSLYQNFYKKNVSFKSFNSFEFWGPVIFFIIAVISAVVSKNHEVGLKAVIKRLPILLLPFIVLSLANKKEIINKVFLYFSISVIIATSFLSSLLIINLFEGKPFKQLIFHNYTSIFSQHPVYYSLYIVLSIFYITNSIISKKIKRGNIILALISLLILLTGLVFASSKAILFIFVILYIFQLLITISRLKFKIVVLGIFIAGGIIVFNATHLKERFYEGLEISRALDFKTSPGFENVKTFNSNEKRQISDLEIRHIFLKIGFYHTIYDKKYWFGYGLGDVQNNLDYYYMKYNLAPRWYEGYNLHNQYLQIFVTFGIFALLYFLTYLFYSLSVAIKKKDILFILFLCLMLFVFTFEVYLTRNKGMLFFYFFITLFLINNKNFENSHTRN